MKTIDERVIKVEEGIDFRKLRLDEGCILDKDGGILEFVKETFYVGERLVIFWTARREGEGIAESHYSVNEKTGKEHQDYSGICYGQDTEIQTSDRTYPFHASERYFELNDFLQKLGR